jgi:hypothetical protein
MSEIQDRLKKLIEKLDLNPNSFSERVETSSSVIYHIIGGRRNQPSADLLGKISMAFARVNMTWLLTGFGSMFVEEKSGELAVREPQVGYGKMGASPSVVTVDQAGADNMILVPVKAQAGYIRGIRDREYFEKLPSFRLPKYSNGIYRAFEVEGYSMLTEQGIGLHPTDYAIGRFVEKVEDIKDNKVYIIVNDSAGVDDIVIKRCFNTIKAYEWLLCKSDNRNGEYPDIHLDPATIKEVWEWKGLLTAYYPNVTDIYEELNQIKIEIAYLHQQITKPKEIIT